MSSWGRCSFFLGLILIEGRAAAAPQRHGFTGDISLGFSLTTRTTHTVFGCTSAVCNTQEESHTVLEPGLAGLSLSLGGYLSPPVALTFRAASTSYFLNKQYVHAFYGPAVELWPADRVFFGLGAGLGAFGPNPLTSPSGRIESAFALDLRAGVALINARSNDLIVALEVIPGFYNDFRLGTALTVGWKWY